MAAPSTFSWSFRDVKIVSTKKTIFIAGFDKDDNTSYYLSWDGEWSSASFSAELIGCCPLYPLGTGALFLGLHGEIVRAVPSGFTREVIDLSESGPQHIGDMREIRTIGERAYAVGMGRVAYRCDGVEKWTRIDQSCRCPTDDESDAGFNSIHGFSEMDIYAVGWDGELWHFDGKTWEMLPSPTNLALFRVVCAPDGNVYACGQVGTILKGKKSSWEVIENDATQADFYGATFFKGKMFFSTTDGLFTIEDNQVAPLEIKSDKKLTFKRAQSFLKLDANDDILWSVGNKMALYSADGINWTETTYK